MGPEAGCPASRPVAARGLGPQRRRTRWGPGPGGRAGSRVEAASPGAFLPLGRRTPDSHPPGVGVDGAARAPFLSFAAGGPRPAPLVSLGPLILGSQCHLGSPSCTGVLAASPRAQLLAHNATQVWPCPRRPASGRASPPPCSNC